jgi:hypothetical protein
MGAWAARSIRTPECRATPPAFSRLVAIHRSHSRSQGENSERILQDIYKYQRHPLSNQRKKEGRQDGPATPSQRHSSWSWGFLQCRSGFSDTSTGQGNKYWNLDSYKRMELLKQYIEADPYRALFGRRLDSFRKSERCDTSWNDFLQSSSSTERPIKTSSTGAAQWQTRSDDNHIGLQYDPISGRMAPMAPMAPMARTTSQTFNSETNLESRTGNEGEKKFTANPSLVGGGKQDNSQLNTESLLGSQSTAECTPGNELEALFTSSPTTQSAQARVQVPEETTKKANVNIDWSPGHELESLFIAESARSKQAETARTEPNSTDKKPNSDAGLTSGVDVECPSGSELEAKFLSDPANRPGKSLLSEVSTKHPDASSRNNVDCPLGNDLKANPTAELVSRNIESDDHVQTNTESEQLIPRESVDCSPGSEIEAHILSESISKQNRQSEVNPFVDCPPGSELDAKLTVDPTSAEDGPFQEAMTPSLDTAKSASINVDYSPGSELDAMLIADSASASGFDANNDIDALGANDTNTQFASKSKEHDRPSNFDALEGQIGDFIIQNQTPATEDSPQLSASQQAFPEFHIFAFDSSTSEVMTAKSDSFFDIDEETRPSEILSRLQNPAKFLPYFEKMQKDGYEIVAGGGNIIVFRKIHSALHSTQKTGEQDPAVHAEIAKHAQDSKDFTPPPRGSSGQSTAEVSGQ